jgi:hypothetical protein
MAMHIKKEPDYWTLENNIIDVIKEEQIKLGYRNETIRLYYPMESLNNLLGTDLSINDLNDELERFCLSVKARLGDVKISYKETRFCILIPPTGVTYVHEEVEDRYFLREFIDKMSKHICTIEDILEVFYRYSNNINCIKMTNGEFDYLIYFEGGLPDAYMYCIKFEDCHAIYHRFTKNDYISFGF